MKTLYFLVLSYLFTCPLFGQWSQVGEDLDSAGHYDAIEIAFHPTTNELYTAYPDLATNTFRVEKFDGNSWTQIGSDIGNASDDTRISIIFNPVTNEPYVAYPDIGSYKVLKFDGNTWVQIGADLGTNFSIGFRISIGFQPTTNQVYVAYPDTVDNSFKVQMFDGNSWIQVGTDLGLTSERSSVALTFHPVTNEPYVSHPDNNTFKIQKFDGSNWVQVGTITDSVNPQCKSDIAFDLSTNEPYVFYSEGVNHSYKVKRFDGTSWLQLGSIQEFADYDSESSIAFHPITNQVYIAYADDVGHTFKIRYFEAGEWLQVGSNIGYASSGSLATAPIDIAFQPLINEPIVAYNDGSLNAYVIQKFEASPNPVTDDMESYTEGEAIFEGWWGSWGGCDVLGCALESSSVQAYSGNLSGLVPGDSSTNPDLNLGNKTSGEWALEFQMYIPENKEGYFNLQGEIPITTGEWIVGNIFFNKDLANPGVGHFDNSALGIVEFDFPHGEWFSVIMNVDLTNGMSEATWEFIVDGEIVLPTGTPFTDNSGAIPTSFGGISFFSISIFNEYYLDDFNYIEGVILGTNDVNDLDFSIYPNPAKNNINISTKEAIEKIHIYSIQGILVKEITNNKTMDVSNLSNGIYFIEVTSGKRKSVQKIIKL